MWITLTGFMGAGKSTVSRLVGNALDCAVVCLDERIAERTGAGIPEIFAERGEQRFRALELEELGRLDRSRHLILDAGGGLVETAAAVALLRARGPVLWLDVDWPAVRDRLRGAEEAARRPLVEGLGWDGLEELYHRRHLLYAQAADFRLRTEVLKPEEVANVVVRRVRAWSPPAIESAGESA